MAKACKKKRRLDDDKIRKIDAAVRAGKSARKCAHIFDVGKSTVFDIKKRNLPKYRKVLDGEAGGQDGMGGARKSAPEASDQSSDEVQDGGAVLVTDARKSPSKKRKSSKPPTDPSKVIAVAAALRDGMVIKDRSPAALVKDIAKKFGIGESTVREIRSPKRARLCKILEGCDGVPAGEQPGK